MPIDAIAPTPPLMPGHGAQPPSPELVTLENKFNRLMLDAPLDSSPPASQQPTAISELIRHQDQLQHQLVRDVARFSEQAPSMDMSTLTAHQVEMTFRVAQVQLQFTAATSVAQSTKSGLQTLMKNQ